MARLCQKVKMSVLLTWVSRVTSSWSLLTEHVLVALLTEHVLVE